MTSHVRLALWTLNLKLELLWPSLDFTVKNLTDLKTYFQFSSAVYSDAFKNQYSIFNPRYKNIDYLPKNFITLKSYQKILVKIARFLSSFFDSPHHATKRKK